MTISQAQVFLFVFLGSVALGTLIGGPIGDRIGRKRVIWGSIWGVIPFALALPYLGLMWTAAFSIVIGFTMASASSAIVVYGMDLVPGKIGTIAGLFFGLSFGLAGIGAAALGRLADATSITFVYHVCAFLPLIGLLTVFLPDIGRRLRQPA
jgi:FSR family fosmidomycin resistance protein-like MFS transporter